MSRRRLLLLAVLVLFIAAVAGTVLLDRRKPPPLGRIPNSPTAHSGFRAVPPATVPAPHTPAERRFNSALASGLAASGQLQTAAAAPVPAPGFSPGWPPLAPSNSAYRWAETFTARLLDIDFAHQTRAGLGGWLMAVEAPELLPGIPSSVANKILYLSLLDRAAAGGGATPVPNGSEWAADAKAGVRWHVSHLSVSTDPTFSRFVAEGWQPPDARFGLLDVTGRLTVTAKNADSATTFRFGLYVGSAHWQHGYGSVLVTNWKDS